MKYLLWIHRLENEVFDEEKIEKGTSIPTCFRVMI